MVPLVFVVLEFEVHKVFEPFERRMRAAGKAVDWSDSAVELREARADVAGEIETRQSFRWFPRVSRLDLLCRNKILRQFSLQVGTEMVQQHKAAIENARRHNHVGIDGPIRKLEPLGKHTAPAFRLAAWILVANQQRRTGLFEKSLERIIGVLPHYEAHAALRRILRHVSQSLMQKVVMPQIGVGIIRNHLEVRNHRQAEKVSRFDCNIERLIVYDAHRTLHPVDDALRAGTRRPAATDDDARLISQFREFVGHLRSFNDGTHL